MSSEFVNGLIKLINDFPEKITDELEKEYDEFMDYLKPFDSYGFGYPEDFLEAAEEYRKKDRDAGLPSKINLYYYFKVFKDLKKKKMNERASKNI